MSRVAKATQCALALATAKNAEIPMRGDLDMLAWCEFRRCGGMNLDPGLWSLADGAEETLSELVEKCLRYEDSPSVAVSKWLFETDASFRYLKRDVNAMVRDQYGVKWDEFQQFISEQVLNWTLRMACIRDVSTGMRDISELESFPRPLPLHLRY